MAQLPKPLSIYLSCTKGGSNKEYHVFLKPNLDQSLWVVSAKYGPKFQVSRMAEKGQFPSYSEACKMFNDVVSGKLKKGYEKFSGDTLDQFDSLTEHVDLKPLDMTYKSKASALLKSAMW